MSAIAETKEALDVAVREISQPNTRGKTHTISEWAKESMGCKTFMARFKTFKAKANDVFDHKMDGEFPITTEFDLMNMGFGAEWKRVINQGLEVIAQKIGQTDIHHAPAAYAAKQVAEIKRLGYKLTPAMERDLTFLITRFYICDVGPAPFSMYAVEANDEMKADKMVTVSHHCLQMATHWLRHPPSFMTVRELDEFICLSLFHDVFYFDDYLHHDDKILETLGPYLQTTAGSDVVCGHLNLTPDRKAVQEMKFSSPTEALRQEWVQMDWYLTMVNLQNESQLPGLNIVLPFEFFHHLIGRVFTHNVNVIPQSKATLEDAKPVWLTAVAEKEKEKTN